MRTNLIPTGLVRHHKVPTQIYLVLNSVLQLQRIIAASQGTLTCQGYFTTIIKVLEKSVS